MSDPLIFDAPIVFRPQVVDKPEGVISPQVVDKICPQVWDGLDHPIFHVPWGHQRYLIDKFRDDPDSAMFYVRETVKNGWSRAVLLNFLDTKLHERQGKAVSNFAVALPNADSDLAQEITKDPYCFDFIALTPKYREKELKDAMMSHIEKFLLELGQGFMLVGREYRLEIGEDVVVGGTMTIVNKEKDQMLRISDKEICLSRANGCNGSVYGLDDDESWLCEGDYLGDYPGQMEAIRNAVIDFFERCHEKGM